MKKKTILILVVILTSISVFAYVQAKKPGTSDSSKEAYSDYLDLPYDATSVSSTYTPLSPETVSVWIFPDKDIDDGDYFQVDVYYNDLWTYNSFEKNGYQFYNMYPLLVVDRADIAYPMTIRIYRIGNAGEDTETFEIQWIVEH